MVYDVEAAAAYLGLTRRGVQYHIYETGKLVPDGLVGRSPYFNQATLDAFKQVRQVERNTHHERRGRPPVVSP